MINTKLDHECLKNIYVKISNDVFKKYNGKNGLKYLLLVCFFRRFCSNDGILFTSIKFMAQYNGFSCSSNTKSIQVEIKNMLKTLVESDYIYIDTSIDALKDNTMFMIKFNNKTMFGNKGYNTIYIDIYEKIVNSTFKNKALLISSYFSIRKNIYNSNKSLGLSIMSIKTIMTELGYSYSSSIKSAIKELIDLGIIYKNTDKYFYKNKRNGFYYNICNVYAINQDNLKYTRQCLQDKYYNVKLYTELTPEEIKNIHIE